MAFRHHSKFFPLLYNFIVFCSYTYIIPKNLLQEFRIEMYFASETRLNRILFFTCTCFLTLTSDCPAGISGKLEEVRGMKHSNLSRGVGGGDNGRGSQ